MAPKRKRQGEAAEGRRFYALDMSSPFHPGREADSSRGREHLGGPPTSMRPLSGMLPFSSEAPMLGPVQPPRYSQDGSENPDWLNYQSTLRLKSKWESIYERYKDAHLMEQDEIEMTYEERKSKNGASSSKKRSYRNQDSKARRGLAGPARPGGRKIGGDVSSEDDTGDHSDASEASNGSSSASLSSFTTGAGIKVVKDCGILRNLAGRLRFGSFIKDEELDALEAEEFFVEDHSLPPNYSNGPISDDITSSSLSGTPQVANSHRQRKQKALEDGEHLSEIEVDSDEDEIGGWGETGFLRSQYPDPASCISTSRPHSDAAPAPSLGREDLVDSDRRSSVLDPDLEEFLLAEERRRRLCADDDDSDNAGGFGVIEDVLQLDPVVRDESTTPGPPSLAAEIEVPSSDEDDLNLLASPRKRGKRQRAQRPNSHAGMVLKAPEEAVHLSLHAPSQSRSISVKIETHTPIPNSSASFLASFEEATRAKRAAIDSILMRWTSEQETFLARLEEEAQYRFDLGIDRAMGGRGGPRAFPDAGYDASSDAFDAPDPWDSLPASYSSIPGLEQMLVAHS